VKWVNILVTVVPVELQMCIMAPILHKVQQSHSGVTYNRMTYNVFSGTLNPTHFTSLTTVTRIQNTSESLPKFNRLFSGS